MNARVRHLPGDVLGLDTFAREVLAQRPLPGALRGARMPARMQEFGFDEAEFDPTLLERSELVATLRAHVDPHHPDPTRLHPAVDASIAALGDPRGVAVVASARPAFLGGPLETLFAALHAIALARALARAHDRPVVPVLWITSDDHDQREAGGAWILNRNLDLARSALPSMGSGRRPLAAIALHERAHRLDALRAQLRQLLGDTPHRDPAIELFTPRDGETLGAALRRAFGALLGDLGLVCIEPCALRDTLSRALARAVAVGDAALVASSHLDPTVADGDVALFRHIDGQRHALRLVERNFVFEAEDAERSGRELAAEIADRPQEFSAGPLLESLVRDLVLPVAANVATWSDVRLHAATTAWRSALDAPAPALVPRQRTTLLTPTTREALRKRGVGLEAVLRGHELGNLEANEPAQRPSVLERLRETTQRHADELKALRADLSEIEKGLAHRLRRAADENADRIETLRARAERVVANRSGTTRRHERRLANTLLPRERPQEEVLTTAQFTAAFGTDWIAELAAAVDPFASEHLVLEL